MMSQHRGKGELQVGTATGMPAPTMSSPACRRLDSRDLFGSGKELVIDHLGASYRLHLTRQGKLILTK